MFIFSNSEFFFIFSRQAKYIAIYTAVGILQNRKSKIIDAVSEPAAVSFSFVVTTSLITLPFSSVKVLVEL